MSTTPVFVTGMQRSGTTLLQRLLDARADAGVLAQPFPLMFVAAKQAFLRSRGFPPQRYPLGHGFHDDGHDPLALAAFLTHWQVRRDELWRLCTDMLAYTGQYTPVDPAQADAAWIEAPFAAQLAALYRALAPPHAILAGGKETTCEEFLPHLLDRGFRCVLLLRDPRDVLASLDHGSGEAHAGAAKPTLFNLRQWRKSVAYALALEGRAGFHWLRYEDLVADPLREQRRLAQALGLPANDDAVVIDLGGWRGNSSHGAREGISGASVGSHRAVLAPAVSRFVEAACHAELRALGYATTLAADQVPAALASFEEPHATRPELAAELPDRENLEREHARFMALRSMPTASTGVMGFPFAEAAPRLQGAMR